jgi:hypothetical protein
MSSLRDVPELDLPHVHRGKVRDLFDAGDDRLLMVASDRLSAFDVVMDEPVPNKGRVLTAMSAHWFAELSGILGNHLISTDIDDLPEVARRRADPPMIPGLAAQIPGIVPKAKRVIFLFMGGGPSQQDLFDPKPFITGKHGQTIDSPLRKEVTQVGTEKYLALDR